MTNIDMKQKIKEVRDKFLSSNQIEDIRQNITLGVEERLKFLNQYLVATHLALDLSRIQVIDEDGLKSETDKGTPNLKDWKFAFRAFDSRGGGLLCGYIGGDQK